MNNPDFNMKNICILLMSGLPLPAVRGGAIETLCQLFIDQNEVEKKYNITVLCTLDKQAEYESKKYQYAKFVYFKPSNHFDRIFGFISRGLYRAFRIVTPFSTGFIKALKYLKVNKFDLVINETWKIYTSPLVFKAVKNGKVLLHLHRVGEKKKGDISTRIDKSINTLVTVSDYVANDWIQHTGRSKKDTYVLFNCCDANSIEKKIDENEVASLKEQYGIGKDDVVLLFYGRITNEKGVLELVDAINILNNDKCVLLIVGGSQNGDKTKYENLLDEAISNSTARIVRTGYVDNAKMYYFSNIADLIILPSTCPDAAPLTVIEAMTAGKPIITTNNGGIPEYTKDSAIRIDCTSSLAYDLARNIGDLIKDDQLRSELGEKAKITSKNFTPRRYFNDFSRIIDDVCE
jgi:glycosyltransferase involved in cell wall biosynthesis